MGSCPQPFNPVRPWPSISAPKSSFLCSAWSGWMGWPVSVLGLALASALTVAARGQEALLLRLRGQPAGCAVSITTRPAPHLSCSRVAGLMWMKPPLDDFPRRHSPRHRGRFVIIRATGTDAYNPYICYSDATSNTGSTPADGWVGARPRGLSSVETLVILSTAAANDPFVNQVVSQAHAVFIAGGSGRLHQELEGHRTRSHPADLDGPSSAVGGT